MLLIQRFQWYPLLATALLSLTNGTVEGCARALEKRCSLETIAEQIANALSSNQAYLWPRLCH